MDNAELLKAEYFHLQTVIETFDQRALTIKAWSVSLGAAVVALAREETLGLAVVAGSSLMFWVLEGYWKGFQDAFYVRVWELEAFFAGEIPEPVPLQIRRSWLHEWHTISKRRLPHIMRWPHVALPHLAVLIVALFLLFVS
jgi:hypothetical protein